MQPGYHTGTNQIHRREGRWVHEPVSMNDVEKRIIEISYREKISHLSSNLNAVNIIEEIYKNKQADEPFILSSGHAALAWYVVLE